MKPLLYYCYDAYCGWCYGNSANMRLVYKEYANKLDFEVLSGGMVISETPQPIAATAAYIQTAYKRVEEYTGMQFGEDYLWHIFNPEKSDWFPNSEKPAIALSIFKEHHVDLQIPFIADLQYALYYEGRDLCDNEAYRHLLEKYKLDVDDFFAKLAMAEYKEKAYTEFALCKQLQVTGFPTTYIQMPDNKLYVVANGFMPYDQLKLAIDKILSNNVIAN
jgi:putative protein-disulfide isomerase